MRLKLRLRLDAAARVLAFQKAHPDPSPPAAASVERLVTLLRRVSAMLLEQLRSQDELREALREREAIAAEVTGYLAHLGRLLSAVATLDARPELRLHRRSLSTRGTFLAAARDGLVRGEDHRERLLEAGMPAYLLDDLADAIARYQAAEERRARCHDLGHRATATFVSAAQESHAIISHLDALNRLRFANDPAQLSAWHDASAVRWTDRGSEGTAERRNDGTAERGNDGTALRETDEPWARSVGSASSRSPAGASAPLADDRAPIRSGAAATRTPADAELRP